MTTRFEISVIPDGITWIATVKPSNGNEFVLCVNGATEEEALDNAEAAIRQAVEIYNAGKRKET